MLVVFVDLQINSLPWRC